MKTNFLIPFLVFVSGIIISSCGSSDQLNVKGDPEAVKMAEDMVKALGGKKAWAKVNSVYIRTISTTSSQINPVIIEEWISLKELKFLNKRIEDDSPVFRIINNNDGWIVNNGNITMIPPGGITGYREWYDHYLLVNLKRLAEEKENISLTKKDDNRFDLYVDQQPNCSFELNDEYKIGRYYTYMSNDRTGSVFIRKYREYGGYVFPLEISSEGTMSLFTTDYFDPSHLEAEKAFNVTFDPNKIAAQ